MNRKEAVVQQFGIETSLQRRTNRLFETNECCTMMIVNPHAQSSSWTNTTNSFPDGDFWHARMNKICILPHENRPFLKISFHFIFHSEIRNWNLKFELVNLSKFLYGHIQFHFLNYYANINIIYSATCDAALKMLLYFLQIVVLVLKLKHWNWNQFLSISWLHLPDKCTYANFFSPLVHPPEKMNMLKNTC